MTDAFICDAVRTPIGRYGGALAECPHRRSRRDPAQGADGAQPGGRLGALDDVIYGCANQAGEDNRNVARMAVLLAGLPAACRAPRSTGCAVPAWTRSATPRAPFAGRRDGIR